MAVKKYRQSGCAANSECRQIVSRESEHSSNGFKLWNLNGLGGTPDWEFHY